LLLYLLSSHSIEVLRWYEVPIPLDEVRHIDIYAVAVAVVDDEDDAVVVILTQAMVVAVVDCYHYRYYLHHLQLQSEPWGSMIQKYSLAGLFMFEFECTLDGTNNETNETCQCVWCMVFFSQSK
jgi:hypothetical protein